LKPGLLTGDGIDFCGDLSVHALGLEPEAMAPAAGHRLDWTSLATDLPAVLARRTRNVHKGSFGTLAIVGGADGMVGAPLLAGRAALHAGAGKVWIGFVGGNAPAVDWGQPELMLRQADGVVGAGAGAMICGPGLGVAPAAKAILARAIAERVPLVLDADALNAIAAHPELARAVTRREAPTLVTPHPAEAARLLGMDTGAVQADRVGAAQALAMRLQAAVVLKGAGSVLAYPEGTWDINASGNASQIGWAAANNGMLAPVTFATSSEDINRHTSKNVSGPNTEPLGRSCSKKRTGRSSSSRATARKLSRKRAGTNCIVLGSSMLLLSPRRHHLCRQCILLISHGYQVSILPIFHETHKA